MEIRTLSLLTRAFWYTGFAVASAAGFGFAWTAPDLSDFARRALAFLACALFVLFFHEAARCWSHLGEARGKRRGQSAA